MKLVALFVAMLAVVNADDAWNKPSPPTGVADKINKVSPGSEYKVPQGSGQPLPERQAGHKNPHVTVPSTAVEAGKPVEIKWGEAGDCGWVNIDVINTCGLMNQPLHIATVPASQHSYNWNVPKYLKDGDCYNIRVWGHEQPRQGESNGNTGNIKVQNNDPRANSRFIVNNVDRVEPGKPCKVSWDYSPVSNHPAMVDVRLCSTNEKGEQKWQHIATVPCDQKEYTWTPSEEHLKDGSKHHIQVAGGPITEDCNFGANSEVFVVNNDITEVIEVNPPLGEESTETVVEEVHETIVESGAVVAKGVGMVVVVAIIVPLVMLL